MTTSRDQQILASLLARINGVALSDVPKPAGLVAERSRMREVAPSSLPAVTILPLTEEVTPRGAVHECKLTVKIVIHARAATGGIIDDALDPVFQWVYQQVMFDQTLGGLAITTSSVSRAWGFAVFQQVFGDLDLHYEIVYRRSAFNPTLAQ